MRECFRPDTAIGTGGVPVQGLQRGKQVGDDAGFEAIRVRQSHDGWLWRRRDVYLPFFGNCDGIILFLRAPFPRWIVILMPIDRTDRRILRLLQQDGRMTNLKLAEEVHLSPTATLERVRRLTADGYVLGYRAVLDPQNLGVGLLIFVEVPLDRTTPNVLEELKRAVAERPEVMECYLVAGGFDYLMKLRAADMSDYREMAGRVLWRLPGVRETRTYAVIEEVKNSAAIHLDR